MTSLSDIWPPFGLRITAGPVQLSAVRDEDIPALVELVQAGIHEPDAMPFAVPWSAPAPPAELAHSMATHYWETRAQFRPDRWNLELVVRWDGVVVGIQGFEASDYLVTHSGETGSWLGRACQGRGIGTAMRQAICAFLFDYLDAQEITSAAFLDNPASWAVSRKVGYAANGMFRQKRRDGELAICRRLRLRPEDFVPGPCHPTVEGLAPLRRFLGLDA